MQSGNKTIEGHWLFYGWFGLLLCFGFYTLPGLIQYERNVCCPHSFLLFPDWVSFIVLGFTLALSTRHIRILVGLKPGIHRSLGFSLLLLSLLLLIYLDWFHPELFTTNGDSTYFESFYKPTVQVFGYGNSMFSNQQEYTSLGQFLKSLKITLLISCIAGFIALRKTK
ncbi:MAG: hypothetical protein EP332_13250 [Bacteroidetes bacterium]|nr:MAG: hypothetical protein EP332_13250 [Bacteroidota bacterium]